jgi:lipopolysaccharide transport system permease protein
MVQIWMFATPVAYPASLVPARWQWILYLNPMAGVIEGFRSTFLGRPFDTIELLVSFAVAVILFVIGILYFEKVERQFADII